MTKLSEIIPYRILMVHGKIMNDCQDCETPGSSFKISLNRSWMPRDDRVRKPWSRYWRPRRIRNDLSYWLNKVSKPNKYHSPLVVYSGGWFSRDVFGF